MKSKLPAINLYVIPLLLAGAVWAENPVSPRYENVVLRTSPDDGEPIGGLLYEGNNLTMRGKISPEGLPAHRGEALANRWREAAQKTRTVFAFRDSLFGQQDHPVLTGPTAVLLPPNWITSAVTAKEIVPVQSFDIEADALWTQAKSTRALFGSFPASDLLFAWSTAGLRGKSPSDQEKIRNARATLQVLSGYSKQLASAAKAGSTDAIIEVGADLMASSDSRYFTPELRKTRVVVVFVENPATHEIEEGKGFDLPGVEVSPSVMDKMRNTVFRRRLEEGDIAIERYDLSEEADVKRAVRILEGLIPGNEPQPGKGIVWLWVHGRKAPDYQKSEVKVFQSEDGTAYVADFRRRLAKSNVDTSRLRLLSKPSIRIPLNKDGRKTLDREIDRSNDLGIPLSTNLTTAGFRSLFPK